MHVSLNLLCPLLVFAALSGCIQSEDEPTPTDILPPSPSPSSINVSFKLQHETLLVRFYTDNGIDSLSWSFPGVGEDYLAGIFVLGGGHHVAWGYEHTAHIQIQDNALGHFGPGGGGWARGSGDGPFGPGIHDVVFHADDIPVSFNVTAENATYEILTEETATVRLIEQDHPEWNRFLHVHAGYVGHFDAEFEITPSFKTIQLHILNSGFKGRTQIDLGFDQCTSTGNIFTSTILAQTDQTATIRAESNSFMDRSPVRMFILETTLESESYGCYGRE